MRLGQLEGLPEKVLIELEISLDIEEMALIIYKTTNYSVSLKKAKIIAQALSSQIKKILKIERTT